MAVSIIFLYIIVLFIALPLIITLIYKHFYNNHVNEVLNAGDGKKLKKWLAPVSLFIILCCAEVLLFLLITFLGSVNGSKDDQSAAYELGKVCKTMTQSEIDDTIYKCFDGNEVAGYSLSYKSEGNFTCFEYTNTDGNMLPAYVLRIEYTGSDEIGSWDDDIRIGEESTGTMEDVEKGSPMVLYVVISDDVETDSGLSGENISYTLYLYTEKMSEYNTGDLGTYDMPDALDLFTVNIR